MASGAGQDELQEHHADLTVEIYKDRFQRYYEALLNHMEYLYGLNFVIVDKLIFTDRELCNFKELMNNSFKINEEILKSLSEKNEREYFADFLDALEETCQSHLKSLVVTDGKFDIDKEDRPLGKAQVEYLKRNHSKIVFCLNKEVTEISNRLLQAACINEYHLQTLTLKNLRDVDRADDLISIMKNRSVKHFKVFRQTLQQGNSSAYALTDIEKLSSSYITTAMAVTTAVSGQVTNTKLNSGTDRDKSDSKDVSNKVATTLRNNSDIISRVDMTTNICKIGAKSNIELSLGLDKCKYAEKQVVENFSNRMLSLLDDMNLKNIIALMCGRSIMVYFRCDSKESLKKFRESVESGSMKKSLETFFNHLLGSESSVRLRVERVFMMDFCIQEFYQRYDRPHADVDNNFLRNGEKEIGMIFQNTSTSMKVVKQKILLKIYFWRVCSKNKSLSRFDSDALESVSFVCKDWRDISKSGYFKRALRAAKTGLSNTKVFSTMSFSLPELTESFSRVWNEQLKSTHYQAVEYLLKEFDAQKLAEGFIFLMNENEQLKASIRQNNKVLRCTISALMDSKSTASHQATEQVDVSSQSQSDPVAEGSKIGLPAASLTDYQANNDLSKVDNKDDLLRQLQEEKKLHADTQESMKDLMKEYHDVFHRYEQTKKLVAESEMAKSTMEAQMESLILDINHTKEELRQKKDQLNLQNIEELAARAVQADIFKADFEAERKSKEDLNDVKLLLEARVEQLEKEIQQSRSFRAAVGNNPSNSRQNEESRFAPEPPFRQIDRALVSIFTSTVSHQPSSHQPSSTVELLEFECPFCRQVFPDADSLELHVNDDHPEES